MKKTALQLKEEWEKSQQQRQLNQELYLAKKRNFVNMVSIIMAIFGFIMYYMFVFSMPSIGGWLVGMVGMILGLIIGRICSVLLLHRIISMIMTGILLSLGLVISSKIGLWTFTPSFMGFVQMSIVAGFPIIGYGLGYIIEEWDNSHIQISNASNKTLNGSA